MQEEELGLHDDKDNLYHDPGSLHRPVCLHPRGGDVRLPGGLLLLPLVQGGQLCSVQHPTPQVRTDLHTVLHHTVLHCITTVNNFKCS